MSEIEKQEMKEAEMKYSVNKVYIEAIPFPFISAVEITHWRNLRDKPGKPVKWCYVFDREGAIVAGTVKSSIFPLLRPGDHVAFKYSYSNQSDFIPCSLIVGKLYYERDKSWGKGYPVVERVVGPEDIEVSC